MTNNNFVSSIDEFTIKLIGKISLNYPEVFDLNLDNQIRLRNIIEEVAYNYDITPTETSLVVSDTHERINIFLACRKLDGLSPKTLSNYEYSLRHFADTIIKPINSVNAMDIRIYISSFNGENQTSSINTKIFILKSFFKWLHREEYIMRNPMDKINVIKTPIIKKKPMTDDQLELMRENCKTLRDRLLIEIAISTGCRVSEISNIKISDIDFSNRSITVLGKGNKERRVLFSSKTLFLLNKYLEERVHNSEYLFISYKKPYNKIGTRVLEKDIRTIKERAGLIGCEITPHTFRRTFATNGCEKRYEDRKRTNAIRSFVSCNNYETLR